MPSLTHVPQVVRQQMKEIVIKHGVNYSDAVNELFHLISDERPVYHPSQVGGQWQMEIIWNTKYGEVIATGLGHNKRAGRREAAGDLLCELGLISRVEPKLSHLKGAAQRQRRYESEEYEDYRPLKEWRRTG